MLTLKRVNCLGQLSDVVSEKKICPCEFVCYVKTCDSGNAKTLRVHQLQPPEGYGQLTSRLGTHGRHDMVYELLAKQSTVFNRQTNSIK